MVSVKCKKVKHNATGDVAKVKFLQAEDPASEEVSGEMSLARGNTRAQSAGGGPNADGTGTDRSEPEA